MRTYFRHRIAIDWSISGITAATFAAFLHNGHLTPSVDAIDGRIFLTTGTIAATLLGFSLASASFLISHTNSGSMEFLRKAKSFNQLIQLFESTLWRFLGLAVISLLTFVGYKAVPTIALSVFIALSAASIMAAITLIWSVTAILRLSK